jgi:hypothetical protein
VIYYGDLDNQTCTNLRTFVKEPAEKHCCVLILNIILLAATVVGLMMVVILKLPAWFLAQFIGLPFILYIVFGLCINNIKPYFTNMKPYGNL